MLVQVRRKFDEKQQVEEEKLMFRWSGERRRAYMIAACYSHIKEQSTKAINISRWHESLFARITMWLVVFTPPSVQ